MLIWRRSYDIAPNALSEDDPRNPRFENRYQEVPDAELPRTESLKDTIERIMPYWKCIIFPNLKTVMKFWLLPTEIVCAASSST